MYQPGQVRAGVGVTEPLMPPAAPSKPGFFQVTTDIRLHYFAVGQGEEILVIHGGPGLAPGEPWPAAPLLADRFRLVFYHQRGCGRSTRPFERAPDGGMDTFRRVHDKLGLGAQVADIERIRRLLGKEQVTLLGHSFGALIAALYASEFPGHPGCRDSQLG
jgi:proline iminopeptidase